jgi:hypothetical protein
MKRTLIGYTAAITSVLLAVTALASSFPNEANPGNVPPQIHMLISKYDVCSNDYCGVGSQPDGFNSQDDGCIGLPGETRFGEYAFTGENIGWLIAVRDLNGAEDISYTKMTVDGYTEALCHDVTAIAGPQFIGDDRIPEKPFAPQGFYEPTDKIFLCVLTVEPSWYGQSSVNVEAYDQTGAYSTMSIAQGWFFNPAIIVDLDTNDGAPKIWYEDGLPGQTVYSGNKLIVTNLAEGGVDLWAFLAADDLTDPGHSGAMCPVSNVLDVDKYMDYRCKIGTAEDDNWHPITNKINTQGCWPLSCMNAQPLIWGFPQGSMIFNQKDAECQFRLEYPVPCIGDFTEGMIHVLVRAV